MAISKINPIEKYIELYNSQFAPSKISKQNAVFSEQDALKQNAEQSYNDGVSKLNNTYSDIERALLVQKLMNERKIKEQNENLGLTKSGKNISDLAAGEIAYSSSLAKAKLAKQSAKEKLLNDKINAENNIALNTQKQLNDIDAKYEELVNDAARNARNDDISADLKQQSLDIKAEAEKNKAAQDNSAKKEKTPDEILQENLVSGIKRAMIYGSGYLYTYIDSLNLDASKMPILKTALTIAGVPVSFYEHFADGLFNEIEFIPID